METLLLRDQQTPPSGEVLENALGESYSVYGDLMKIITGPKYSLIPEWNYYRDGKAWLCKVCFKKKTVFWLSVWEGFFKTAFYFTEKHIGAITELAIDEKIKEDFSRAKPAGKLIPLVINVNRKEQIKDIITVIGFKTKLSFQ